MSGLFGSLNSGVQALNAQAKALEVTGKNLANVNNPDYARQRVVFGDRGTVLTPQGPQSLGLEAMAVNSVRDRLMDAQVVREASMSSALRAESWALQQAQAVLGEGIDRSGAGAPGISDSLNNLFSAFSSVANDPTDIGERQGLVAQADILVNQLNVVDQRLQDLQLGLNDAVVTDLTAANDLLKTIAELNGQIGRLEIGRPGTAVDLRDQREAAIERLGTYLTVETRPSAAQEGQLDIFTRASDGSEMLLIDLATVAAPLSFDGNQLQAGTPAVNLAPRGGSIQGHLKARDGAIADLRSRLDDLATHLVTEINGIYNPDGTGPNFFDPAGLTASTIRLDPGLTPANLRTSISGISGDNTLANQLAALGKKVFSVSAGDAFDGTFSSFHAGTISALGNAVASSESRLSDQSRIESLVRAQRDSMSGVSLDEEMVNLTKYQRSFQASSRVVQVVDDLLDVIVNRLVR